MCTEKDVLVKKISTNGLNMGLLLQTWVEKTVDEGVAHWLSCKEKVPVAAVCQKSYTDSVLGHKRTHHNWLSFKKIQQQTVSPVVKSLGNILLSLLNDIRIYTYIYLYIYIYICVCVCVCVCVRARVQTGGYLPCLAYWYQACTIGTQWELNSLAVVC